MSFPAGAVDNDVSIDDLRRAVEHLHCITARLVEAVEVDERAGGEILWQGTVKVFDVSGHPSGATRAYAWSHRRDGARRVFKAVLSVPPVNTPAIAVRASMSAEIQNGLASDLE